MNGVIIVNKSEGWTSHDVVAKVRNLSRIKKVGHLGTLDPAATGVLPLVVGRATRLAQFYTASDKVYDATIHFGWTTDSYDREGEITSEKHEPELDCERVEELLNAFRGTFEQMPPPVSAKKIGGTPAYKLARKKKPVELKPVEVAVHRLDLVECSGATARIEVHCSGGTYLRSIAHELGQEYGCGAFLERLTRLRSGEFALEEAHTIPEMEALAEADRIADVVVPAARMLPEMATQTVDRLTETQIRQGRDFRGSPFRSGKQPKLIKAISEDGDLIAIGEARLPNAYHPIVVL
jgi:tRNA pseudouridine55 synthase